MPSPLVAATALETPRLRLHASDPKLSREVLDFFVRNRAHFAPWDPPYPLDFTTLRWQRMRLLREQRAFAAGESFRYWVELKDDPGRVVGQLHFSAIVRGVFHNAMLGYQIDETLQGRGLMREAVQAGIAQMFAPPVRLHRIQAAHLVENRRSAAVLARLGFEGIGVARRYLFIAGQWRDHVMTALINPDFDEPPAL